MPFIVNGSSHWAEWLKGQERVEITRCREQVASPPACYRAVCQPVNIVLMTSSAREIYTSRPPLNGVSVRMCVYQMCVWLSTSVFFSSSSLFFSLHPVMIHDTLNYTLYYVHCPAKILRESRWERGHCEKTTSALWSSFNLFQWKTRSEVGFFGRGGGGVFITPWIMWSARSFHWDKKTF